MGRKGILITITILVVAIIVLALVYRRIDQPFNDVRLSCAVDSDCQLVDKSADFGVCWAGYCPEGDLRGPNVVAVNRLSFRSFGMKQITSTGTNPDTCGVPPVCQYRGIASPTARCVNLVCVKVVP